MLRETAKKQMRLYQKHKLMLTRTNGNKFKHVIYIRAYLKSTSTSIYP